LQLIFSKTNQLSEDTSEISTLSKNSGSSSYKKGKKSQDISSSSIVDVALSSKTNKQSAYTICKQLTAIYSLYKIFVHNFFWLDMIDILI
jgi:hypothetical protein